MMTLPDNDYGTYDSIDVRKGRYQYAEWERPVDYNVYTPLDHWVSGASVFPDGTTERVRQMKVFEDFYNGDYSQFISAPVRVNYHMIVANTLADILMAFPPEYPEHERITPRLIQSLNLSLYNAITDMVRFGTGVFNIVDGVFGAEVDSPLATYWYPADAATDAILSFYPNSIVKTVNLPDGVVIHTEYHRQDHNDYQLGQELGGEQLTIGTPAHWQFIQEQSIGRVGTIQTIARRPVYGEWGRSLYADMTSLAFELVKRYSEASDILTEHGNPMLLLNRNDAQFATPQNPFSNEKATLKYREEAKRNDTWRNTYIASVPSGYDAADYLFWNGNLDSHYKQTDAIENQLWATTNLPAQFYSYYKQGATVPASGVALRMQFLRSHIYVKQIQSAIINTLRKLLLIGATINGASVSDLQTIADTEIVWQNIFDEMDNQSEVVLDGDDAESESEEEVEEVEEVEEEEEEEEVGDGIL